MSEIVKQKAEAALAEITEATVALPEPVDANAVVPLSEADAPVSAEITKRMAELDMSNTNSIVSFGSAAQAELQTISQAMLQDVRNKDVGPAGDSLRDIVTTIRGFSVSELDVRRERSFWEKLIGRAAPFAKFTARFEEGFRLFRITGPTIFLPWLTWLPSIRRTCDKLKANRAAMLSFVG
ncbi:MAG: toxic anion resistance protein, partial [Pseudomonadota bacterium]|nr:toxic anion resistance protein [Pseudomonadota bacterium]